MLDAVLIDLISNHLLARFLRCNDSFMQDRSPRKDYFTLTPYFALICGSMCISLVEMSRIRFHSPEQETEVSGAERYYFNSLCSEAFLSAADLRAKHKSEKDYDWLKPLLPESAYFIKSPLHGRFVEDLETWAYSGDLMGETDGILIDGERHGLFSLQLNSAYVIGGDALKLAARIHGQCEIHCYVEAPNRLWLASVIEQALEDNTFREGIRGHPMGWHNVISHLRDGGNTPVVCSYSVCESFPNPFMVPGLADPETCSGIDEDKWDKCDQWALCMEALRNKNINSELELKPNDWQTFRFSGGKSGFDLRAQKWKTTELQEV